MLTNSISGSRQNLLPFELATMNSSMANLYIASSIDYNVMNSVAYESELAKLGFGVVPLAHSIEISLMWYAVAELATCEEN